MTYNYEQELERLHTIRKFLNSSSLVGISQLPVILFAVFARFEYALKRAKFIRGNKNKCAPDWYKFTSSIDESFSATQVYKFTEAREYFDSAPPQKQAVRNKQLAWKQAVRTGECDSLWYGLLVRHVRNNLFHGEKMNVFNNDTRLAEGASRNHKLLFYSLVMLEAFLACHDEVKRLFLNS